MTAILTGESQESIHIMTKMEIIASLREVNYAREDKSSGRFVDVQGSTEGVLLRVGRMEMTGGGSSALLFQGLRREIHNPNPGLRRLALQFPN
jgi:hypothetical protein